MRVCVFCVFVVALQLGEFVGYTLTDDCAIHIFHESLLVEYGEPVEVNCSITTKPTQFKLGWETTFNPIETSEETSLVWSVSSLTRWEVNTENLFCYLSALVEGGNITQCKKTIQLTLYKRPDSVMIHSESDVWSEGELRNLTCEIKNVGPVCNLTVQWTRVDQNRTRTVINSSDVTISGNLGEGNVTDTLEVSAGRDEDGVQYQCAALLNLNLLEQLQVGVSQLLTISVHYKPTVTQPSSGSVSITKGDTLMVNCEAHGNPDPQYTWTRSSSTITNSSLLNISNVRSEHQGEYTCMASNSEGSASVKVTVNVTEDTLPIMASCVVVAVALLIAGLCTWFWKNYRHKQITSS